MEYETGKGILTQAKVHYSSWCIPAVGLQKLFLLSDFVVASFSLYLSNCTCKTYDGKNYPVFTQYNVTVLCMQ